MLIFFKSTLIFFQCSLRKVLLIKVVVALLLSARIVLRKIVATFVKILKLLLADCRRDYYIAVLILRQDASLEQTVNLSLDNFLLPHLLSHCSVLLLQLVELGQLGLNQLLLPSGILLILLHLLLGAPTSS